MEYLRTRARVRLRLAHQTCLVLTPACAERELGRVDEMLPPRNLVAYVRNQCV